MATGPIGTVLQQLRRAALTRDGAALTDGELLQAFRDQRDEAAFEALVRRHGPMVLGVCRRILNHAQDAEDAFQATFLVLARKAASIMPADMVGNWLYGVAYRSAQKARAANLKRRTRERQVQEMPQPEPGDDVLWRDLQPLLDQELHRLPDKYRVPVVLCDLEGKTRTEAARQLGWPEGTLSWRLASARNMLAQRLTRRGLALSAGTLAVALAQQASAAVAAPLVTSTVKAATLAASSQAVAAGLISSQAAALTEGVIQTMYATRLKIALAVGLALTVLSTGVGVVSYQTLARDPDERGRDAGAAQAQERREAAGAQGRDTAARGRDARKAPSFQGKISAISADGKMLTLEVGGGRGEQAKTFEVKLGDKTKISFPRNLGDLGTKLKVGDTAMVWLQDGSKDTAELVEAFRNPDLTGKVSAVAADSKSFTIETPGPGRGEVTKTEIKLTDKTKFAAGRGEADTRPQVGYNAMVWLEEGSKDTAIGVQTAKRRPDVAGSVSAISADGKVLTIESKNRGGETIKHDVKLTDSTKIEFTGGEVPADKKLKVGYGVMVWFQEGSSDTAASVEAMTTAARARQRAADVSGTISAVAADGKSLTIEHGKRGEEPTKTEIKLTDKTSIDYTGTDKAEEKKLTVGYRVSVWLQEGSKDTAAAVQAAKVPERTR